MRVGQLYLECDFPGEDRRDGPGCHQVDQEAQSEDRFNAAFPTLSLELLVICHADPTLLLAREQAQSVLLRSARNMIAGLEQQLYRLRHAFYSPRRYTLRGNVYLAEHLVKDHHWSKSIRYTL